jgi:hypothetical protein
VYKQKDEEDSMRADTIPYRICAVVSFLFLIYGCSLVFKSHAGFAPSRHVDTRWPYLGDKPVGEDGFYMLTVADHLAQTHHLVYNQSMPATGIQPLSTFVFAGLAVITNHFGGNDFTLVRATLLFGLMLFILFAWQLAFFSASVAPPEMKRLVFLLAFFLTLFDFTAFRLFEYGLESGVYLVAIAACMTVWCRMTSASRARWRDVLLFGLCCGIAGLARIDFGIVTAVLLSYLLLKKFASLLQILASGFVALLVVAPWFAFVHSVTGGWLPSSGRAESALINSHSLARLGAAYVSFAAHIFPWSFAMANQPPTRWAVLLSFPPMLYLIVRSRRSFPALLRFLPPGFFTAWLPAVIVLCCTYVVFFWAAHFYPRYFAPLLILAVPLLAMLFASQRPVQKAPALLCGGLIFFFVLWDVSSLHTGHVGNGQFLAAGYIQNTFPTARVGSFQSGVIGYFDSNVENLDGKLNQGAGQAKFTHTLPQYVDEQKIDVLVDWPGYLASLPSWYLQEQWHSCPVPMHETESICLIRNKPFDPALLPAADARVSP